MDNVCIEKIHPKRRFFQKSTLYRSRILEIKLNRVRILFFMVSLLCTGCQYENHSTTTKSIPSSAFFIDSLSLKNEVEKWVYTINAIDAELSKSDLDMEEDEKADLINKTVLKYVNKTDTSLVLSFHFSLPDNSKKDNRFSYVGDSYKGRNYFDLNCPFHTINIDTTGISSNRKIGIDMYKIDLASQNGNSYNYAIRLLPLPRIMTEKYIRFDFRVLLPSKYNAYMDSKYEMCRK
jgi:hypothetical protein